MLQAPPTILEQVMAIRGFIIQFPMSSLWHVGDNSFFVTVHRVAKSDALQTT